MKLFKYFLVSTLVLSIFFSCKKKDNEAVELPNYIGNPQVFIAPTSTDDQLRLIETKYKATDTIININVEIKLGNTTKAAESDVYVYLKRVDALVTDYDASLTIPSPIPQAWTYDVSQPLVIKKGERTVTFNVKLNPSKITAESEALGFSIEKVSSGYEVQPGEGNHIILIYNLDKGVIVNLNEYDGKYSLTGTFFRSDNLTLVGVSSSPTGYFYPYLLISSGDDAVEASIESAGTTYNTQVVYNTATPGFTYFSAVAPKLVINSATKAVTVVSGTANTPPATALTQDATELAASKYYPTGIPGFSTEKTIVAHFRWSASGVDRIAKDTFEYVEPR